MHSKVFLARSGHRCWLWVGSHNLTASAMEGANCEAAVALEGSADEEPFRDALAHLNRCRDEAIVFDPFHPPDSPGSQDVLIRPQSNAPTQRVFRIEAEGDRSTVWLRIDPTPKLEPIVGRVWSTELDPGLKKFFTPASVHGGSALSP